MKTMKTVTLTSVGAGFALATCLSLASATPGQAADAASVARSAVASHAAPQASSSPELIYNNKTGLCLAVYGGSGAGAGAKLVQWNCPTQTTAHPDQWWRFTTNGSAPILYNGTTGLCLGIEGGGAVQGGKAVQKPCNGASDETWHREWLGSDRSGKYRIQRDGTNLCLSIYGGVYTQGAQAVQWTCNYNDEAQVWSTDPVN